MIPSGYHRIRPDLPALVDGAGNAAAPIPGSNPGWPVLIRLKAIPKYGNISQPSFTEHDWYTYCGPVRSDAAYAIVEQWKASAFASGYHLTFERIHILPSLAGIPWPGPGGCFGWQPETGRPPPVRAVLQNFKVSLYQSPPMAESQGQIA